MIHFEGIIGKSGIWINGRLIRESFGSYYPIQLDGTEYLKYGQENVIALRADNSNDPEYAAVRAELNQQMLSFLPSKEERVKKAKIILETPSTFRKGRQP